MAKTCCLADALNSMLLVRPWVINTMGQIVPCDHYWIVKKKKKDWMSNFSSVVKTNKVYKTELWS